MCGHKENTNIKTGPELAHLAHAPRDNKSLFGRRSQRNSKKLRLEVSCKMQIRINCSVSLKLTIYIYVYLLVCKQKIEEISCVFLDFLSNLLIRFINSIYSPK